MSSSSDPKLETEDVARSLLEAPSSHVFKYDGEAEQIVWPVYFMYPEFKETDFIAEWYEGVTLSEQLDEVFAELPPWDTKGDYRLDNLEVYFEDIAGSDRSARLMKVNPGCSLGKVLSHPRYTVKDGFPSFIILSKSGPFRDTFLATYRQ